MNDNACYKVVSRRAASVKVAIRTDEYIELTSIGAQTKCPHLLRRTVVEDAEHQREIVLLTNLLDLAATTMARLYKERWQTELFFKALMQNIKVKTFVGTSENAVKKQIWTALLAILLLEFLQMKSTCGWNLSNLAALLRMNLLTYDLWAWLDDPYGVSIAEPPPQQLTPAI